MKRKVMKVLVSVVALCVLALMAAPKAFAQATLPPPLNLDGGECVLPSTQPSTKGQLRFHLRG
jgi:hypothetical protein